MKISDVLWKAANQHLWNGMREYWWNPRRNEYSCNAVALALGLGFDLMEDAVAHEDGQRVCEFLCSLGVDCGSSEEFNDFPYGEQRQGARYLWLMFAYLVALDEGL